MPRDINERLIMKTKRSVCTGPNGEELWAVFNGKGKRIGGVWVRVPNTQLHSDSPCGVWAVFDSDKRRVRGLWYRFANGPFYAQIDEKTPKGERRSIKVPLDADTLAKAREAHRRLVIKSKDGELPVLAKLHRLMSMRAGSLSNYKSQARN